MRRPDAAGALIGAAYAVAGFVNVVPVIGLAGSGAILRLYGLQVDDADVMALLRHRAVLLGLVGVALLVAAWRPSWRVATGVFGLASMLSYVAVLAGGDHGAALLRVMWIDVAVAPLLLLAWFLQCRRDRSAG